MKTLHLLRVFIVFFIPLVIATSGCDSKDRLVTIRYQQVANFDEYSIKDLFIGHPTSRYHLYMLKSISNTGKDAETFTFNVRKLHAKGVSANSGSMGITDDAARYDKNFMNTFAKIQVAKGEVFVPGNEGSLFVLDDTIDNSSEQEYTDIVYRIEGNDPPTLSFTLGKVNKIDSVFYFRQLNLNTIPVVVEHKNNIDKLYNAAGELNK